MKNILVIVAFLFSTVLFAQQGSIRGTVLDKEMNNEPLLFANITLKGDQINEQTNLFGNFELNNINPGEHIIQISFAGYAPKEVMVNVKPNETIEIQETLAAITFDFDETLINSKVINEEKIALNISN